MSVLDEIAARRSERVTREGPALGVAVPVAREVPVVPFGRDPFVVCEIKRRSPSRGDISAGLDPASQAARYVEAGIRSISVLTEEDHFGGSLADLIRVKTAFPNAAVLRKDFLLDEADIDLSYRAGADAVLLIAALLDRQRFEAMHRRAKALGLSALVEVHSAEEIECVRAAAPDLVGVNSRDLTTFNVDPLLPVRLRPLIDWSCRTIFESGVFGSEEAALAANAGFDGVLVGEAVVREPERIPAIISGLREPGTEGRFWTRLFQRDPRRRGPLVKVCGITTAEDAAKADALGADLLGFIFAESPRRVDPALLRRLPETRARRVAVVVLNERADDIDPEIPALLADGFLDAVQLHGNESAAAVRSLQFPRYKALRPAAVAELDRVHEYGTLRTLVDAYSKNAYGGTGRRIAPGIVAAARRHGPLWMAGGIGADNAAQIILDYAPELIDASSRLESKPGRKDHELLTRFFEEIAKAGAAESIGETG